MKTILLSLLLITLSILLHAQAVPADDENIPYLMTFGKDAETSWGDDDYSQTFFFKIPKESTKGFYIRIFDPECSGLIDEVNGEFNTIMSYMILGGDGCWSDEDAQGTDPVGNYRSGNLLLRKGFTEFDTRFDNKWWTSGPFSPSEGEWVEQENGYVFKIIIEGVFGDDGNLYKMFLSTEADDNKAIEGANAFTYEYSFRMHDNPNEVSHIYPYIDSRTVSIKLSNFDWDNDGCIRIVSIIRKGQITSVSGEDEWVNEEMNIIDRELNSSLDFQFIKSKSNEVKNNNVVVNIRNQYDEALKFYVIPIGGVPKYIYAIHAKKTVLEK